AEKIKDLDSNLSLSIAQAQAAVKDGSWTPQTSEVFWNAFSKLCDLIQPVKMDSIAAAKRNIAPSKRKFWKTEKNISVAERSSRRYLKALFALILIIMPLQLYVWTCTNLAKKIDDLTSANQAIIAKNSASFRKLAAATATSSLEQPHNWTTEEGAELAQLDSGLEEIQSNSDRAEAEARLLRDLSTLFLSRYAPGLPAQTVNENDWYRRYIGLLSRNSQRQIDILKIEEQANLIVGTIASFILPVLF